MAKYNHTTISKKLFVDGGTDLVYGPYDSISQFKADMEEELIDLYRPMTVAITQADGTFKEYWNGESQSSDQFTVKNNSSSGTAPTINVVDNLTSTSTTDALSANQGRALANSKLDADTPFVTINGQSIKQKKNLIIGNDSGLVTHTARVIDMQPSYSGYTLNKDAARELHMQAGVTYHIGCAKFYVDNGRTYNGAISNVSFQVWYEDGTSFEQVWNRPDSISPTDPLYWREHEFTPTKNVTHVTFWAAGAGQFPATGNTALGAARFWIWHEEETAAETSPWNGKYWILLGDSIWVDNKHLGQNTLANESSAYMLADKLGMILFNFSVGGYFAANFIGLADNLSYTDESDGKKKLCVPADIITIALGNNNAGALHPTPLGSFSDSYYKEFKENPTGYKNTDMLSYCCELQLVYDGFHNIAPGVPVTFLSGVQNWDQGNAASDGKGNYKNAYGTIFDYNKKTAEVAEQLGCQFISICECCSPKTLVDRTYWYTSPNEYIHPAENGHRYRILPVLDRLFKDIAPYEGVEMI